MQDNNHKKTNYAAIIAVTIAVLISVSAIVAAIILVPKGSHKDSKLEQAEEALERSQRNTDRRQDMSYVLSAFIDYQSNNNGNFPEEQGLHGKFLENYILKGNDEFFTDPDGTMYHFSSIHNWADGKPQGYIPAEGSHEISVNYSAKCVENDDALLTKAGGKREIAIIYALEGGAFYCGDNQ